MPSQHIEVHRAADRFRSSAEGVESRHCFSHGEHYHPANISFGSLVAMNDEVLQPGFGFDWHRHSAIEIVTWVVSGTLHHEDSAGHRSDVSVGVVQRLSAGSGVRHAERAPSVARYPARTAEPTRFVQMWLTSDAPTAEPDYQSAAVGKHDWSSGLAVVATGRRGHVHPGTLSMAHAGGSVLVGRLLADQALAVPDARLVHLYVVRGSVHLDGANRLEEGDSARLVAPTATSLHSLDEAEILVVEMDSSPENGADEALH